MTALIENLEQWAESDSRVRAILRRSLSFPPGAYPAAFPYVEWALTGEESAWRREVTYLAAALWAMHWRDGRGRQRMGLGAACAALRASSRGSESTERRFINLLDADRDQLPHRLRQVIGLLKDYDLDFQALLTGLLHWEDDRKRTQNLWARDFYRKTRGSQDPTADDIKEVSDEDHG